MRTAAARRVVPLATCLIVASCLCTRQLLLRMAAAVHRCRSPIVCTCLSPRQQLTLLSLAGSNCHTLNQTEEAEVLLDVCGMLEIFASGSPAGTAGA